MLYYKTIAPETLELLKKIQEIELFKKLRLVGGTSLALQIGHRISIDLDLFGEINVPKLEITTALNQLGILKTIHSTNNIFIYSLNGIKVAIVNYPYPWLSNTLKIDQTNLATTKDIAAMKLAAITGRGSKKDFIDIYFLFKQYTLKQMLHFYNEKYHDGSEFLVLKSLAYFTDADDEIMPKMLNIITWNTMKEKIKEILNDYILNN